MKQEPAHDTRSSSRSVPPGPLVDDHAGGDHCCAESAGGADGGGVSGCYPDQRADPELSAASAVHLSHHHLSRPLVGAAVDRVHRAAVPEYSRIDRLMIELAGSDIGRWVAGYLWVFFRIGAVLMTMPVIGTQLLPMRIRLYLALALTALVAPQIAEVPQLEPLALSTWVVIAEQILIGASMGFLLQLLFQIHVIAGQIVAMQMGLGFASMNDPAMGISVAVVAQVFTMLVTLLFLALNGHLVVIEVLVESFTTLPIGQTLQAVDFHTLVLRFSWVMASALLIGLPAITALLIVNLSFGVMMRAAPQLNIFSIGFPLTLVFGLFILWVLLGNAAGQYHLLASEALIWLREMVGAR